MSLISRQRAATPRFLFSASRSLGTQHSALSTTPHFLRLAFLVSLCAILFLHQLADRDLWSSHEGRAAQNAQTILDTGSFGVPRLFDKRLELQKPPLYYWMVAAVGKVSVGRVDAWAVRLPAALTGILTVASLYGFGVRLGRPVAGFVAACVLATAVHFTALARTGRIDMPLTLAVAVAIGAFYLGQCRIREAGKPRAWFIVSYVAMAVGVMLKGPIGLVLPVAVIGTHLLVNRELPKPRRLREWGRLARDYGIWWGLPFVLLLAAPWYVWASIETNGSFIHSFFWHHNVERAFGADTGMHGRPWYYYGVYLATHFLPWSVLLPPAIWYWWRNRDDTDAQFGIVWLLTVMAVLSLAQFKRADYLLPAFPAAAWLIGYAGENWLRASAHPRRWATAFGLVLVGCVTGWLIFIHAVLPAQEPARECERFAAEIRKIVPAPNLVLFFRAEAHALAFHLGPELDTFLEWENLDIWAGRPGSHYIIMPAECADEWPVHVKAGELEVVMRGTDFHGEEFHCRPLVLMRTHPRAQ